MSKAKRKFKLSNSVVFAVVVAVVMNILTVLLMFITSRYATIKADFYMIFLGVMIILTLLLNLLLLLGYGKKILWMRKAFVVVGSILVLVIGFSTYYVTRLNSSFDSLVNVDNTEISQYSLITLDKSLTVSDLNANTVIGYVGGDQAFDSMIAEHIVNVSTTASIKKYENYSELFNAYLDGKDVDVAVVPASYRKLGESLDESLQEKLATSISLGTFDVKHVSETSNVNVLNEPFTILFIGVNENLSDSIILASVNPKTLSISLTSVARDSYVPISCYSNQAMDKINHARGRSRQCLIDTVENYLDVNVDFYLETDFYALVKIVDSLGGLELTSPITFAGSFPIENSDEYEGVQVNAGTYTMTGKQVLTFARERKHFTNGGDYVRQMNQQYIIKTLAFEIINRAKTNPNILIDVLDAAEGNIQLSLSMEKDIAPLLGYALNALQGSPVGIADTFTITSAQIIGNSELINGISYEVPYRDSVLEVRSLIKKNMGLEEPKTTTKFSFSINDPYKGFEFNPYVYGNNGYFYGYTESDPVIPTDDEGDTTPSTSTTIPNLTSMTVAQAQSWASEKGIALSINPVIKESTDVFNEGQIIWQSLDAGQYSEKVSNITISVVQIVEVDNPDDDDSPDQNPGDGGSTDPSNPGAGTNPGNGSGEGSN